VLADYPGEVVRMCLLKAHYREDVEYDKDCFRRTREEYEAMRAAIVAASGARGPGTGGKVAELLRSTKERFLLAMDDDFNTRDAIYRLQQMTEALAGLDTVSEAEGRDIVALYRELGGILGLFAKPDTVLADA
jgi:cysteinyl-tRNA synthetase